MKANELRIGNFITEKGKFLRVYSVSAAQAKDYSKRQPIPLTEEWLLKFGFVKTNVPEDDIIYKNKFVMWKRSDGWKLCDHGIESVIYFKHVHQLQNLYFALTGEELEVKQ